MGDTTNGQISERHIDRINDSNNRFQDCAPGTNCWCQETALFFDGAKKKKEIWIPGLLCYSYLGGIAAPGVPCKDQWRCRTIGRPLTPTRPATSFRAICR